MRTPIALFVYNRPHHTLRTMEALRANAGADSSDLFIFSDAPKDESAQKAVDAVRRYVRSARGFRSVTLIERERNFGLAKSIADGASQLCNEYGSAIVLEDDLLTSPNFLAYMNSAIERYAEAPQVMQVSGYMFPIPGDTPTGCFLIPLTTSWGWGVWKRSWDCFDSDMIGFEALATDRRLQRQFDLGASYPYWKMLQQQRLNQLDSWAIRWYLTVFLHRGLTLYPPTSLIQNIGFDGSGTHCETKALSDSASSDDGGAWSFPDILSADVNMLNRIAGFLRKEHRQALIKKLSKRLYDLGRNNP